MLIYFSFPWNIQTEEKYSRTLPIHFNTLWKRVGPINKKCVKSLEFHGRECAVHLNNSREKVF